MNRVTSIVGATFACVTAVASGQSATISLQASTMTAAPGDTVTVSVVADFNVGSAGAGVFGAAGLYGFGGDVSASGAGAGGAVASGTSVDGMLSFGATASEPNSGSSLVRAAGGRGFDGGLASGPVTVATFDVTIDNAATGSLTLDYDGAVVLVQDNALVTYATAPGANQMMLSVSPVTITIGASRLCADQNEDGDLTGADFNAFLTNFSAGDLKADVNGDGSLTGADFNGWLTAFSAGQAGPTCNP